MGPTPPSLGRVIPSRAVSPMDSKVMVATASQGILQAMARAPMVLMDRPRTQAMALSQLPRDMAQLVAMVVARVLSHLMGSSPTLAMGSSQLLAAALEVTVAVLRAATTGSPRVGAMVSSLAMVDSSLAMDSSKAPIILLRAMDSRTSITVALEVAEGVVEVAMVKISPP